MLEPDPLSDFDPLVWSLSSAERDRAACDRQASPLHLHQGRSLESQGVRRDLLRVGEVTPQNGASGGLMAGPRLGKRTERPAVFGASVSPRKPSATPPNI